MITASANCTVQVWDSPQPPIDSVLCADQAYMLLDAPDVPIGRSRLEQCDQILQTADQFQDIHLLAVANDVRASIMKHKR